MSVLNINLTNEIMCCCRMFNSRAYYVAGCVNMHCSAPLKERLNM